MLSSHIRSSSSTSSNYSHEELLAFKDFAVHTVKEAAKSTIENFDKLKEIKEKTVENMKSFVSNADLEAEKIIIDLIKKKYPQHNILSEETGEILGTSNISIGQDKKCTSQVQNYTWIIDPIDGTHNYIYDSPMFCINLALAKGNEVLVGIIYLPLLDEMYYAMKGEGAYLISRGKQRKLSVTNRNNFDGSLILYGSAFYLKQERIVKSFENLGKKAFRVRILGVAGINLAFIAAGRADLYIDFNTNPWDIAPGFLIAEEAGARITDIEGKPWTLDIKDFLVSNGNFHEDILKEIVNK